LDCSSIVVTERDPAHDSSPGLLGSIQQLVATLVEILETRIEIIATEFEEERERLRELVMFGFLALFFGSLGLVLLTLFIVIQYWETYRLMVIGGFAFLYLGIGIICGATLRRRLRERSRLFSTTLSEMAKDRGALHGDRGME